MLEVKNLSLKLGRKEILHHISFNANPGRIIVLLGKNGSGKTTLLRALSSNLLTKSGDVAVDGIELNEINIKEYVKKIAFLPQTLNKPAISIEQLACFGRFPYLKNLNDMKQSDKEYIDSILSKLDLFRIKDQLVCHLSSGQRQLAYFALMQSKDCPYNLLDEPTSNLDTEVRKMVFDQIRRMKEEGKTIIISLHDLNEAIDLADEVIVMDKGEIILKGETNIFLLSDLPEQLFGCQRLQLKDESGKEYIIFK